MATFFAIFLPFLFNWMILFVACYAVVEFGQNYLYDEKTPNAPLKVAAGSLILAALLTWTKTSYDTMFTSEIGKTVVLGIVAFGVFVLIFRFHPWHGFGIGLASVLLISGVATMAVDSFRNRDRPLPRSVTTPSKPLRRTNAGAPAITPPAPAEKK